MLLLEGKISKEWVSELRSEIKRGIKEGERIVLDFSKVSFLDEEAAEMINDFPLQKVEKRNCSLFIRTMLGMETR